MPESSRALFTGIIDYAGLFPPAKLPMDEAFRRFLAHQTGNDGWLLARFVCPASRLAELSPMIDEAEAGENTIRIAALGAGGDDPPGFAESMERDVSAMGVFNDHHKDAALIDVFEIKLPGQGEPASVVDFTHDECAGRLVQPPTIFFEVSLLDGWKHRLHEAVDAISAASHELDRSRSGGLKIRCGGLEASAVPSVDAVASAILAARDAKLPLKATQGLHHPIRHLDDSLGTTVHGFLNLTAAAILAGSHGLDEPTIREILADEDPSSFALTDTAIRWRDIETPIAEASTGRTTAFTSFGSCSFSEPRDDLSSLGLI